MTEAHWSLRPPDEEETTPRSEERNAKAQERLARVVQDKLTLGYRVETQTDTRAVVVRPARRVLGIELPGRATREVISIDHRGNPTVQTQ